MFKKTRKKETVLTPKRIPQTFIQAAEDFEKFKVDELKKSRKLAWGIAFVCAGITGFAVVGIVMSFFLHTEPEPVVLKVDNGTGNVEMLRSLKDQYDSHDEVVNKYWLANYVRTCERYDWYTISVDYKACELFSSSDVFREYANRVQAKDAPLNLLKDKGKIEVKIISIAFLGANNAQVRYTKQKLNAAGEDDGQPLQRWLATISYQYQSMLMTEQQRLVNPLGFKVFSYRPDPEVLSSK
jgi:type IV secretion system protein VirB8